LHLGLTALVVAVLCLVALLGRRLYSWQGTSFAVAYFAVASTFAYPAVDLMAFHTEWVVILCECAAVLSCWKALEGGQPSVLGFLSGTLFGLACFSKQPAALDALASVAFVACWSFSGLRGSPELTRRRALHVGLSMVLGGAVVATLVSAYFWMHGAWSDFVFYTWTYNTKYYIKAMPLYVRARTMYQVLQVAPGSMGLGVLASLGAFQLASHWLARSAERPSSSWYLLHVSFWAVSSLAAVLAGGRLFTHYFIFVVPSWSLLAGFAFESLAGRLIPLDGPESAPSFPTRPGLLRAGVVGAAILGGGALVPLVNAGHYFSLIRSSQAGGQLQSLCEFLRRECPPDQKIVVWGFMPEIYVLTDRDPATKYSYMTFVAGIIPGVGVKSRDEALRWRIPGSIETFLDELQVRQPLFIVDCSRIKGHGFELFPLDDFPPLANVLKRHYQLVPEFSQGSATGDGFCVYKRRQESRQRQGSSGGRVPALRATTGPTVGGKTAAAPPHWEPGQCSSFAHPPRPLPSPSSSIAELLPSGAARARRSQAASV
jgi:hypothetical protein